MKKNIIAFVLNSPSRKEIVEKLFAYPKRQWSCSMMEDIARLPHATVFRALNGLLEFGVLKSTKINKRDILYEFCESSLNTIILKQIMKTPHATLKELLSVVLRKIPKTNVVSIILYGSSVTENLQAGSDIDILFILKKHDVAFERNTLNLLSSYSSEINKTISPTIMTLSEFQKEKEKQFLQSVKKNNEVLCGKDPF